MEYLISADAGTTTSGAGHLGTTDDCGFAPFSDISTSSDTASEKLRSRVPGTRLAQEILEA